MQVQGSYAAERHQTPLYRLPSNRLKDLKLIIFNGFEMLDPLTALGLASNIVSFIDYGCKLISDGYELYGKGTLGGTEELELVTKDLVRLANDLTTNPSFASKPSPTDNGGLQQLAESCKILADQLLRILATLRPSNPRNGLECFRKAIRKARKRGTIENLEKRLEKIQNQLNIRLIAMLRLGFLFQCGSPGKAFSNH